MVVEGPARWGSMFFIKTESTLSQLLLATASSGFWMFVHYIIRVQGLWVQTSWVQGS